MIVVGIDPGIATIGIGIVSEFDGKYEGLYIGCIKTDKKLCAPDRLFEIYNRIGDIISKFSPDHLAIEQIFFNVNSKTAFSVGESRGVIILAAREKGLEIFEYTPLEVKLAVVGYGRAEKVQIQKMVQKLLKLDNPPYPDDAADALAIAICHINSYKMKSLLKDK